MLVGSVAGSALPVGPPLALPGDGSPPGPGLGASGASGVAAGAVTLGATAPEREADTVARGADTGQSTRRAALAQQATPPVRSAAPDRGALPANTGAVTLAAADGPAASGRSGPATPPPDGAPTAEYTEVEWSGTSRHSGDSDTTGDVNRDGNSDGVTMSDNSHEPTNNSTDSDSTGRDSTEGDFTDGGPAGGQSTEDESATDSTEGESAGGDSTRDDSAGDGSTGDGSGGDGATAGQPDGNSTGDYPGAGNWTPRGGWVEPEWVGQAPRRS